MSAEPELVVLVDDAGTPTGTALKRDVHHRSTPLHLAFSCYVFGDDGRLLVTQRAEGKATWPGVWTNSFCGHPAPGEDVESAARRRAADELGIGLTSVRVVLPDFRYQATMQNGVRENELCPVLFADTADDVDPSPAEVMAFEWVRWADFVEDVLSGHAPVSPWCALQVRQLASGGAGSRDPR